MNYAVWKDDRIVNAPEMVGTKEQCEEYADAQNKWYREWAEEVNVILFRIPCFSVEEFTEEDQKEIDLRFAHGVASSPSNLPKRRRLRKGQKL